MKIIVSSKNVTVTDDLRNTIERKLDKLSKYFHDDITAKVMLSKEKKQEKIETTINTKGFVFRAENRGDDIYGAIDKVVDKLSIQMSRFKDKLVKKHKGQVGMNFENLPDADSGNEEIVKRKKFKIQKLKADEAIMHMELIGHSFFLFIDDESGNNCVAYKRRDGGYGILETEN